MSGQHRYRCGSCGTETKTVDKDDDGEYSTTIQSICPFCDGIMTYYAAGTIRYYDRMEALARRGT